MSGFFRISHTWLDFPPSCSHNAAMKTIEKQCPESGATKTPCVYILRCSDGTLYTGWTNDFENRLKAHNSGKGAKYTRGRLPATPVYLEFMPDREAALRRESAIKRLPLKKKQQLILSSVNRLDDFF